VPVLGPPALEQLPDGRFTRGRTRGPFPLGKARDCRTSQPSLVPLDRVPEAGIRCAFRRAGPQEVRLPGLKPNAGPSAGSRARMEFSRPKALSGSRMNRCSRTAEMHLAAIFICLPAPDRGAQAAGPARFCTTAPGMAEAEPVETFWPDGPKGCATVVPARCARGEGLAKIR